MYIATDTTPYGHKVLAIEDLRCTRYNGNRIEFWEHAQWAQPDCVYCRNATDVQYLYGRLWHHYHRELSTKQKVLVNLTAQ